MATDKGGQRGPQSTRQAFSRENDRRSNDRDNRDIAQNTANGLNQGPAPPVPGFGFNFAGMPNMPMFPPNFLNAAGGGQPSAPGQ